jgi:hypothetical protein
LIPYSASGIQCYQAFQAFTSFKTLSIITLPLNFCKIHMKRISKKDLIRRLWGDFEYSLRVFFIPEITQCANFSWLECTMGQ